MTSTRRFRMGKLDHVHIRVPDRSEAAAWYEEHLGFEAVERFDFWATGFDGGPLQISADGGETMLALFEATDSHPMVPQQTGVAFSVDVETFCDFARSLAAWRDQQPGGPAAGARRRDRLRHVLGVRPRRPVGQPVRAQLLRPRPREGGVDRHRRHLTHPLLAESPVRQSGDAATGHAQMRAG